MKKLTILLIVSLFCLPSLLAQSEKTNKLYVVGAPMFVWYGYKGGVDGGGGYDSKMGYSFGVEYGKELTKNFEVMAGLHYSSSKVDYEGAFVGPDYPVYSGSFHLGTLTIPLQAKYTFEKYLFINGGAIVNIKTQGRSHRDDDAIGMIIGLGAEVDFAERYSIIVNPYFQKNLMSNNSYMKYHIFGVKVGVGYRF